MTYNLYFVLETLYGNGKFKKNQILREFCSSQELLDAIEYIKKDIEPEIVSNLNLFREFDQKFIKKTKEEIAEHFIELRGFLHHHTLNRKDIWHPAKQREYKVDAITLLALCHHILSAKAIDVIFKEDRLKEFYNTTVLTEDGRAIRWGDQK